MINNINNINILQHNTAKNSLIQETILEIGLERKVDIILIQEPRIYNSRNSISYLAYNILIPYKNNPRVLIYIKKNIPIRSFIRLDLVDDPDLLLIEVNIKGIQPFYIINIYNELNNSINNNKERTIERALIPLKLDKPALIGGDFNAHHYLWNSSIIHPIRASNLVKWIKKENLDILNNLDISTFSRPNTRSKSIIDLTLATKYLSNRLFNWEILEKEKTGSDHEIIAYSISINSSNITNTTNNRGIDLSLKRTLPPGQELSLKENLYTPIYNIKKIDWLLFNKRFKEKVNNNKLFNSLFFKSLKEEEDIYSILNIDKYKDNPTIPYLEELAINLTSILRELVEELAPIKKISSYSKKWWNKDLKALRKSLSSSKRRYKSTRTLEDFNSFKRARNIYFKEVKKAKSTSWINFLESIDSKSIDIYNPLKIINKKDYTIPTIIYKEDNKEIKANSFKEKSSIFKKALFPNPPISKAINFNNYKDKGWEWPIINSLEISLAINSSNPKKASGLDKISFLIIKEAYKAIPDLFNKIIKLFLNNSYQPRIWKEAIGVIIPKPNKEDRLNPKSYRPISLLNYLGKILEKIIATRLGNLANNPTNTPISLLHPSQIGGRLNRSSIDASLLLLSNIEKNWLKRKITSTIFLDIEGAFNNISKSRLLYIIKILGLPYSLYLYIYNFLSYRKLQIKIEGEIGDLFNINIGIPQGSPLSPILFLIYIRDLFYLDIFKDIFFISYLDNISLSTSSKNPKRNKKRLERAIKDLFINSKERLIEFSTPKTDLIHFSRKRTPIKDKIRIKNTYITPKTQLKWLGILFNNKFTFKEHIINRTNLAKRGLYNLSLLSNTIKGLDFKSIRRLYISIITSILDYGSILWFRNKDKTNNNLLDYYRKIQNKGLRTILGAFKTSPTLALDIEGNLLPPNLRLERKNISFYNRLNYLQNNHPIKEFYKGNSRLDIQISRLYSIREDLYPNSNNSLDLISNKDINNYLLNKWKDSWIKSSKKGREYSYNIDNNPLLRTKPIIIKSFPKPINLAFFQLKLGHGYFKSYLSKINKDNNNKCSRCSKI